MKKKAPVLLGLSLAFALALPSCEQLPELPNVPPVATFVFSPVSPILTGATAVTFNASGSYDSDGDVVSYTWDFGDGSPEQTEGGPRVVHVFPDTAAFCLQITYTVLLTVQDDAGDRGTASARVTVTELPLPTAPECQPVRAR